MPKKEVMIIAIERDPELTLHEICHVCGTTSDLVQELIAYGTIDVQTMDSTRWRFNSQHVRLIRRVLHLQHDLQVNLPGALLAIDLMSQIEVLKAEIDVLEKYLMAAQSS